MSACHGSALTDLPSNVIVRDVAGGVEIEALDGSLRSEHFGPEFLESFVAPGQRSVEVFNSLVDIETNNILFKITRASNDKPWTISMVFVHSYDMAQKQLELLSSSNPQVSAENPKLNRNPWWYDTDSDGLFDQVVIGDNRYNVDYRLSLIGEDSD